jgi:hypothetical protein
MKVSKSFFVAPGSEDNPTDTIKLTRLNLFEEQLLLFEDAVWNVGGSKGDLYIRKKDNDSAILYDRVGTWEQLNSMILLRIRGKGLFYASKLNDTEYNIHEAIAENKFEHLAIEQYKTMTRVVKH